MLHRNLPLPLSGAEQPFSGADLIHLGPGGRNDELLQVLALTQRTQPREEEFGLHSHSDPSQHPGRNIPGTGYRAINAWRSGRRF